MGLFLFIRIRNKRSIKQSFYDKLMANKKPLSINRGFQILGRGRQSTEKIINNIP